MKMAYCLVCRDKYNQEDRCPLLLQCGHSYCRVCLSHMLDQSPSSSVSCPRCRQVCIVGNAVSALRKNYAILLLLQSREDDDDDDDDDDEDEEDEDYEDSFPSYSDGNRGRGASHVNDVDCNGGRGFNWGKRVSEGFRSNRTRSRTNSRENVKSGCVYVNNRRRRVDEGFGSERIDLGVHKEVKMVERIGEGKKTWFGGVEVWAGLAVGRKCKHKVVVKKFVVREEMDVVGMEGRLEELCRKSMWCRNVCTFHGVKRMDDGNVGLVMDRCCGSVKTVMERSGGRPTLEQILRYGADIARGVAELHAAGVVCMSIKPTNILLDEKGHAMVSDYGLPAILRNPDCQKARKECESYNMNPCMDCMMLSINYMAPEAWEPGKRPLNLFRDDAGAICPESDSWSFGCTLLEMCTGCIPWKGLNAEEIYQSLVKAKRQPPQYTSFVGAGIPAEFWKMIGDCLQFKACKRPSFQSMLTLFLQHLQELLNSPPASPGLTGLPGNHGMNSKDPSPLVELEVQQPHPDHLHQLVYEGNISGVRELLAKTASEFGFSFLRSLLEAPNDEGQTALHLACRWANAEVVEAILEYIEEANSDVLDKDGDPPLVFALAARSPECVRSLIKGNANVNSRLREGLGPSIAHVCAYHGQPDCMRVCLFTFVKFHGWTKYYVWKCKS